MESFITSSCCSHHFLCVDNLLKQWNKGNETLPVQMQNMEILQNWSFLIFSAKREVDSMIWAIKSRDNKSGKKTEEKSGGRYTRPSHQGAAGKRELSASDVSSRLFPPQAAKLLGGLQVSLDRRPAPGGRLCGRAASPSSLPQKAFCLELSALTSVLRSFAWECH